MLFIYFNSNLALSQRRRINQNPVAQPPGNGHQHHSSQGDDMHALPQQPLAPRRIIPFTTVPSCTLADALRSDVRGILELCLWPQHPVHNNRPQRGSDVVWSTFSTLEGALDEFQAYGNPQCDEVPLLSPSIISELDTPPSIHDPLQEPYFDNLPTHTAPTSNSSEVDDQLLAPLHPTRVPISQFSTLDGALHG